MNSVILELEKHDLLSYQHELPESTDGPEYYEGLDLTFSGWEEFERMRGREGVGNFAFLAMKFGDEVLDTFVAETLKPLIQDELGHELLDMRDMPEAGVIDNIMRERIRECRYVLADLTHDNNGAYWEAGYAEGLGKPVIFLCEQNKFDKHKSHFDTNHCTTVPWDIGDLSTFKKQIIATVRRSLGLLPQEE